MNRTTLLAALLAVAAIAPAARAQRELKDIPDPDPEVERRSFQVAEGFEVNLFAADPLLAKPIQINFDPQGRLWVASSEVYPQIQPGQKADDKVLILEDGDGDGRADKTTIFARGLLIPTGVEPGDGGAYVANSTELLHFKDNDGDGQADERRVLLSGFGTEDTHHILHTLRWGGDGLLYFNQSTYIHSHIETPYGVRRLGGGGIWQFRPESLRLEVFTRGLINPWGHDVDAWGQHFATDGAGGEGINFMIPGGSYAWTPGAPRIVAGLNPGSPKYSGAEVVDGRHLPDDWQGNILTNDFRANRVCRFVLSDDGSGFAAREQPELIKTAHVAFRPIDIKLGPDGALYVADWYNPIIQHGEVDFRDPRRDHTRGRIWRVTAKGRPTVERPKLVGVPVAGLLDALRAPESWTRRQARRVLKERGAAEVLPALAEWLRQIDPADPAAAHLRLEALWVYQALDVVEPDLLATLLNSAEPRARAAATYVAGYWHDRLSDPAALLAPRAVDEHPRVRLEAVRALAALDNADAAQIALRALSLPTDRFLDYALWLTARDLAPRWLPELEAGRLDFGGDTRALLFALEAAGTREAARLLLTVAGSARVDAARVPTLLGSIGALGTPEELGRALDLALADADAAQRPERLAALVESTARRDVRPAGDLGRLGPLFDAEASRQAAAMAVGAWKVEALRPKVDALALDTTAAPGVRLAALDALARLGGPASVDRLADLSKSSADPAVRRRAIVGLAALDPAAGARRAVAELASLQPGDDPSPLFAAFVGRRGGAEALTNALAGSKLPPDVAKVGLRVVGQSARPDDNLNAAIRRAGGLAGGVVELSAGEVETLLTEVNASGDPARGEAIFRRADLACLRCHAVAGAGGQVGPGLESIGASAPVDYLVTSILQPDKAIKEGYHSTVVATDDGRIVAGIKVRETDRELVLRDAEGQEIALPVAAIDEQKQGGSLMPAGLTDSLTRAELVDLVRFLSALGKPGPYAVGQSRPLRRWRVLEPTGQTTGELRRWGLAALAEPHADWPWTPAYSTVAGDLPRSALGPIAVADAGPRVGVARGELEVTTAGPVRLRLGSTDGLQLWVDDRKVAPAPLLDLDLAAGRHTLTFAVELGRGDAALRCELDDAPGSPARAAFVGGR